jgi:hypothetical protein
MSTYGSVNLYRPLYSNSQKIFSSHESNDEHIQFLPYEQVEKIANQLIFLSARHLRLSQKAINGYLITIRMYACMLQVTDENSIAHLAALLFIERYDPLWLDYYFHERPADKTVFGRIPVINTELKAMLSGEQAYGEFWFRLLGRSYHDSSYSSSVHIIQT